MQDVKERAALASVGASSVLSLAKLAVAIVTGSLALLTEALHGLIDLGATLMTWFAVRLSGKPADEEHHYGHGKVESVTALIEVLLLALLAVFAGSESIRRLVGEAGPVQVSWIPIAVVLGSMGVDFVRARALKQVAQETTSQALEADALHFSSDMWSSAVVLVGLGLVYLGYPKGDAVAALAVAVLIVWAAYGLGRRTIDALMDIAPAGTAERIREIASAVRGVVTVERLRVRTVGPQVLAELTVGIPRTLPLDRVTALKHAITDAVRAAVPEVELTLSTNPLALDDETVLERVLLIAASKRIPVHHVTVQQLAGKLAVALDVEVDGRMSLEAAHTIASRMESAIREEFGPGTEVETHIEPLEPQGLPGREVDEAARAEVQRLICDLAGPKRALGDIHDVRVRDTDRGRLVVLHCLADAALSVADVHRAVDLLEHEIRQARPDIVRVVTHAEPRR